MGHYENYAVRLAKGSAHRARGHVAPIRCRLPFGALAQSCVLGCRVPRCRMSQATRLWSRPALPRALFPSTDLLR